jgi:hypothetical protein
MNKKTKQKTIIKGLFHDETHFKEIMRYLNESKKFSFKETIEQREDEAYSYLNLAVYNGHMKGKMVKI